MPSKVVNNLISTISKAYEFQAQGLSTDVSEDGKLKDAAKGSQKNIEKLRDQMIHSERDDTSKEIIRKSFEFISDANADKPNYDHMNVLKAQINSLWRQLKS